MSNAVLVARGDGLFAVNGAMDFSTVDELLAQGKVMFDGGGSVILDLSEVDRANSAGVVLLLEWQDQALQQGLQLQIHNAPSALVDIARISNCIAILNFGGVIV